MDFGSQRRAEVIVVVSRFETAVLELPAAVRQALAEFGVRPEHSTVEFERETTNTGGTIASVVG